MNLNFALLFPMMFDLVSRLELNSAVLFCTTNEDVWCEAFLSATSQAGVSTCIVSLQPDNQESLTSCSLQQDNQESLTSRSLQQDGQESLTSRSLQQDSQESLTSRSLQPDNQESLTSRSLQQDSQESLTSRSLQQDNHESLTSRSLQQDNQESLTSRSLQQDNEGGLLLQGNETREHLTRVVQQCLVDNHKTSFVIGSAEEILEIIRDASRWELYSKFLHWVSLQTDSNSFSAHTFPVNTFPLIKWTTVSLKQNSWKIRRLFLSDIGFQFTDIAEWPENNGIEQSQNDRKNLTPNTHMDFNGKTLTLSGGTEIYSSFNKKSVIGCYYDADKEIRCTGYVGELINIIASSLHLSIAYKKGGPCGTSLTRNSRMYDVITQAADLTVGTCVLTHDRAQVAKGLEWFEIQGVYIGTAALKTKQEPFLIVNVFQAQVWILVSVATAASTLAFLLVKKILREPGMLTGIPIRTVLNQSSSGVRSTKTSTRCLILVTWGFAIPLLALYGGNLSAFLSSPNFEAPVDSMSDLAARPDKTPILSPNGPIHQMLTNKSGVLNAVLQKSVFDEDMSYSEVSRRIMYGDFAIINSRRAILHRASVLNQEDSQLSTSSCNVRISDDSISFNIISFLSHKNSEFEEAINKRIRQLRSFGIIEKIYQTHVRDACYLQSGRQDREKDSAERLKLQQLQGAFWVFIVGNSAAFAVFLLEKTRHRVLSMKNAQ